MLKHRARPHPQRLGLSRSGVRHRPQSVGTTLWAVSTLKLKNKTPKSLQIKGYFLKDKGHHVKANVAFPTLHNSWRIFTMFTVIPKLFPPPQDSLQWHLMPLNLIKFRAMPCCFPSPALTPCSLYLFPPHIGLQCLVCILFKPLQHFPNPLPLPTTTSFSRAPFPTEAKSSHEYYHIIHLTKGHIFPHIY